MEPENIILVKLARFRRPKAMCFLSYVEYSRPDTNISTIFMKNYANIREREVKQESYKGEYG
jgi:hypothetical protein